MNAKILALLVMFLPFAALAQGFAGLGEESADFAEVTEPAELAFPRDHGPHPEFRIEWWYLTAALEGEDGRLYGSQWTLFRQALDPAPQREGWANQQVWMAHAAVTTPDTHRFAERVARGGIGQAGVALEPFHAWIDDWTMAAAAEGIAELTVEAGGEDFRIDLHVKTEGPLVLHGNRGYSRKSDTDQASYYYSQPFYRARGMLTVDGDAVAVRGTAWLDREWSTQPLTGDQEGWDWVALHLDDGSRLMVAGLRSASMPYRIGTRIEADGRARALAPEGIVLEPRATAAVAGRDIPIAWRVAVPSAGVDVDIRAVNAQSWMGTTFAYWEGPITVTGTHAGRGYLEMTGYE